MVTALMDMTKTNSFVKCGDTILISYVNSANLSPTRLPIWSCGTGRIPMRPYIRNGEHIRTAVGL